MANIIIKNDILEIMLYIWDSVAQREKIGESFLTEVADHKDMQYLYGEDFTKESVRKVLSAISNRELINKPTKKESKFWNNNMWMLEDIVNMQAMIAPVKTLNLNDIAKKIDKDIEVIFVPGHIDDYHIVDNKLIINFFKIMVDFIVQGKITIDGVPFKEYIEEKILSM